MTTTRPAPQEQQENQDAHMPSDVGKKLGPFDKFAEASSVFFSRAPFFAFCVLVVVVWGPSYFLLHSVDKWQLIINTLTTIITFLMVALLQNSERRSDEAIQDKLNAVAGALADLMAVQAERSPEMKDAISELRQAVGLETEESS